MYEHNGKTFADSCKSHQQDPFLGTGGPTKMDEFSEKFQTAFDPHSHPSPPHVWKIILRISRQKCVISRQKCVCSFWRDCYILYDPISHEMHVVQQFNMVKTYPEKTLLYHFHAEKALFKGPKSAI